MCKEELNKKGNAAIMLDYNIIFYQKHCSHEPKKGDF
jgi:hypothetical protein